MPACAVTVTVLARVPVEGRVKTRLAATVGARMACAMHEAMSLDLLEALAARIGPGLVLALDDGAPTGVREAFVARASGIAPGLRVEDQGTGDLGERMAGALARRLGEGGTCAAVVGTDCPDVVGRISALSERLASCDALLVPAQDGGFVLLGAARPIPAELLRGLPWGTDRALRATVEALAGAGWSVDVDPVALLDIDDDASLRLCQQGSRAMAAGCRLAALLGSPPTGDPGAASPGDPVAPSPGEPVAPSPGEPVAARTGDPGAARTGEPVAARTGEPVAARTGEPVAARTGDPGAARTGDPGAPPTGDQGAPWTGDQGAAWTGDRERHDRL